MRTIFKYPLPIVPNGKVAEVEMQAGATIIHFEAMISGSVSDPASITMHPTVWAIVDTEAAKETRRFKVFGTGFRLTPGDVHVGTYPEGPFIWHVFELAGEPLPSVVAELPQEAVDAYRLLTANGFTLNSARAWLAPDNEPLTTELMMAVATLQEHGYGPVISK